MSERLYHLLAVGQKWRLPGKTGICEVVEIRQGRRFTLAMLETPIGQAEMSEPWLNGHAVLVDPDPLPDTERGKR